MDFLFKDAFYSNFVMGRARLQEQMRRVKKRLDKEREML